MSPSVMMPFRMPVRPTMHAAPERCTLPHEIAFTASDLWPGPGWNFVFGLASLRERVGVWSIHRFGNPSKGQAAFTQTLLRTLQFYVAPADQLWLELNQLYLLAERLQFTRATREDPENHHVPTTTIAALYLRAMLLATAKPNQLRPRHLGQLFTSLELWADAAQLVPAAEATLFAVDLQADQGPTYSALLRTALAPRGLDTRPLVRQLERHLRGAPTDITVPDTLSPELVHHLAAAWGSQQPRSQRRTATAVPMKLCVGLRAIHHFLSAGTGAAAQNAAFDARRRGEANPFLQAQARLERRRQRQEARDVWDDAFDLRVRIPNNPDIPDPERILQAGSAPGHPDVDTAPVPQCFDATAVDTSPGGYRVRWNDPLPAHLQTGELAALRESGEARWNVGVIRWIRQDGDGTAMGIELLSPRAVPVAVRLLGTRSGGSAYVRGLILPELRPIGQPVTLLTPPSPFQPGQKIHLQRPGTQSAALLLQRTRKTESFNQFTFQLLAGYLENLELTLKMADQ